MELVEPIVELYRRMSCELPADVTRALEAACEAEERGSPGRDVLETLLENARLARENGRPLCQDTGCPVFYVTRPAASAEADIREAILEATRDATRLGYLRPNAVDPITGENSGDNTGVGFPIIHIMEAGSDAAFEPLSPRRGERVRVRGGEASGVRESGSSDPHPGLLPERERGELVIDAMLKGGGSENVGAGYALPEASLSAGRDLDGVRRCVLDAVWRAQGRGCPPYVVGVAVGGARDQAAALAKKQLLRKLDDASPVDALAKLEARLLGETNRLGIGPAGLGGKTTTIGVKLAAQHRHCACYFVEVAFGCWAMRRARVVLGEKGARHE